MDLEEIMIGVFIFLVYWLILAEGGPDGRIR